MDFGVVSDDGFWSWNGTERVPSSIAPNRWRWNGSQWVRRSHAYVIWSALGLAAWLVATAASEGTSGEIARFPQPDQAFYVAMYQWLPAIPLLLAGVWLLPVAFRRSAWRTWTIVAGAVLFGSSLLVLYISVPKPA